MLKLKLQYFGHLMGRADSLEKTLMLGGIGSRRRSRRQSMRWLDGITWLNGREYDWTPGVGDGQGGLACYDSWGRKESDTTERLNWTESLFGFNFVFFKKQELAPISHINTQYCVFLPLNFFLSRWFSSLWFIFIYCILLIILVVFSWVLQCCFIFYKMRIG